MPPLNSGKQTPPIIHLVIILLVVFIKYGNGICNTDFCKEKSNSLIRGMDLSVSPCDNFYQFVCGNVSNNSNQKNHDVELSDKSSRDLLRLYKADIKNSEHKMVQIAKQLFQRCMNVDDIERDGISSIKDVINKIGGWPVLEDADSIGIKKFDWVRATHKLRELGYPVSLFLDVNVKREKENKQKFYLKIKIIDTTTNEIDIMRDHSESEAIEMMVKVAKLFGAKNESIIVGEMTKVYKFWQETRCCWFSEPTEKYTVQQFQGEYNKDKRTPFNWLEFLNKLVGPQIVVSSNDYILVEDPITVSEWVNTVITTSERTIGNYMIWKLIEKQLPYLPQNIQNIMKYNIKDTREEFCLKLIDQRFLISPIRVINARNLIPEESQQEVQEIFSNITSEFLNLFEKTNWMDEDDKKRTTETIKTLTLIYGLPANYFNDKILDDMDVDLQVDSQLNTFLDLLAQTNRNLQTTLFKQITLPVSSDTRSRPYLIYRLYVPISSMYYNRLENELYLSAQLAYDLQKDTPSYLKYSLIGELFSSFFKTMFGYYDFEFWEPADSQLSQRTMNNTKLLFGCLKDQVHKYNLSDDKQSYSIMDSLTSIVGEKVSYLAYKKWLQDREEEKLPDLSYTSRQLFWITGTYCHISLSYDSIQSPPVKDASYYSNITVISKLNNPYFFEDFKCSKSIGTNPTEQCPLLF
ncbi:hypothetical protein ILUMI_21601 [Ignelater luminosus]|uniref:Peptidase M13 N-terminal domain-containing protein n=1 Tax=Ignelater luminosus TaxID=2038154 RepID=A0A8K0G196_IGNLU|nr:hypothetical protein ILUMI_21601 [Ignelater luminosus]